MKRFLVVLVLTVAVSCGTDPLSACFEEVDGSLDCSHQVFLSVDLSDRNLRNIDLSEADLSKATLTEAVLVGANLAGANLRGANLRGANLGEAYLSWADLTRTDLSGFGGTPPREGYRTRNRGTVISAPPMIGHRGQGPQVNVPVQDVISTHEVVASSQS